jgi:hypothetical protein
MLTIRCGCCKSKVFKYLKIGKGRVLTCWKDKIKKDYSIREGDTVRCQCGNVIGSDIGTGVKMKQHAFTTTGTKV